ncbi:VanZ family protein [Gallaecimonas mangrovi]|uniref:VanZ family protein n=1 Tax=Gallaecimonas mangrovi TaxID=2291597 RepID=UPI000E20498E|nr:VanZ family protein [Gallaecimonas mangrovi]
MQAVLLSPRTYQLLLALAVVTTALFAITKGSYPQPGGDKTVHATTFFVLSLLSFGAWRRSYWQQWLGLAAYGGLIELVQWYIPYRDANIFDWCADLVGMAIAYTLIFAAKRWAK